MLGFAATPQPTDRARQELLGGPMSALPSSVQALLQQTLGVSPTNSPSPVSPPFLAGVYEYDVLHEFFRPADLPVAGLIRASEGNFYGTTLQGGRENAGVVFRTTPTGEVTILTTLGARMGHFPMQG